jgi:hypothetical protein
MTNIDATTTKKQYNMMTELGWVEIPLLLPVFRTVQVEKCCLIPSQTVGVLTF